MLYSPLYQSIRLILFGALSLSSLTVSAAITDDDQQMSEPLATEGAERAVADLDTASANDMAVTSLEKSTAIGSVTAVDNNTALVNDDAQIAANMDTEQIAVVDATIEANTDTDITATNVEKLNFDDDTIQDSLMRLAEFYELKPDSDVTNVNQAATNTAASLVDNDVPIAELDNTLETKQTLPKLGSDLNVVPITVDTAPRCEGQWVYPDRNPNYQRAINEANRDANAPLNDQDSIYAESDYGYYDNVDYAELSGNVIIDQGEQHIEAQKVVLDLSSGVAAAQGQVMFTDQAIGNAPNRGTGTERPAATVNDKVSQGGLIGVADSLNYNTETGQSTAKDVAFASVELQAHGYAKRLNRPNETQYELDEVMFSTCPPTNRKWQFDAKSIDLDTETGRG
ncbi:LptA/OstA family protein, partial [Psychrobacter submarinus]|uniref:LptA/OstA family protein n=1 Tax=Psychrobacter submarinus TaxID=154108 RepID=UPI003F69DBC2